MQKTDRPKTSGFKFPKSPTGIKGLDDITTGGLPKNRPTLLLGNTGCGKTIMVYNLVSNALKFSAPERQLHITIKTEVARGSNFRTEDITDALNRLSPEKKYCHISITDNGIGFDPQYKERIFELFQRLHGKAEFAGTGIGLAIVKKIIEIHHGVITAQSKPGKGATFNIFIPAF